MHVETLWGHFPKSPMGVKLFYLEVLPCVQALSQIWQAEAVWIRYPTLLQDAEAMIHQFAQSGTQVLHWNHVKISGDLQNKTYCWHQTKFAFATTTNRHNEWRRARAPGFGDSWTRRWSVRQIWCELGVSFLVPLWSSQWGIGCWVAEEKPFSLPGGKLS